MDDLSWLRDKTNPAVIRQLEKENAYANKNLKSEKCMYESLLKGIIETDISIPIISKSGEWAYYIRTNKNKRYPVHYRIPVKNRTIKELYEYISNMTYDPNMYFDENDIEEHYNDIGCISNSPDNNMFAITIDYFGNESYEIHVYDFDGNYIQGIENVASWFTWASNTSIYYMTADEKCRIESCWLWDLQKNKHQCLYTEKDEYFNIDMQISSDGKYIFILSSSLTKTEIWAASIINPTEFKCIYPRSFSAIVPRIEHYYGYFMWIDNAGDSDNFRLVCGESAANSRVIMMSSNLYIEEFSVRSNHLCLLGRLNGNTYMCVTSIELEDITNQAWKPNFKQIILPDICETYILDSLWKDKSLYISYSTPIQPEITIEIDIYTLKQSIIKHEITNLDVSKYLYERHYVKGYDNVQIPVTLVRLKDLSLPAPVVQYGYGAYGISVETGFLPDILSLCDEGIIWVIAHVRGGSEMGSEWYLTGKLKHKENTFRDFISVAEYLISMGLTEKGRIIPYGKSAGGLLVGCVLIMRPELWAGAMSCVGFVDVVESMMDSSLPLTIVEREEWGDPRRIEDYNWMSAYDPINGIKMGTKYPPCLFTAGFHDTRVGFWEPVKFAMYLRKASPESSIIVRINMKEGHFTSTDRNKSLQELAIMYTWALDILKTKG